MVNDNNKPEPNQDNSSFEIGKRSITGTKGQTRFEILETNKSSQPMMNAIVKNYGNTVLSIWTKE